MSLNREYLLTGSYSLARIVFLKHFNIAGMKTRDVDDKEISAYPVNSFLTAQHPLGFASSIRVRIEESKGDRLHIQIRVSLLALEIFSITLLAAIIAFLCMVAHFILQIEWNRMFAYTWMINSMAGLGIFLLYYLIRISIRRHLDLIRDEIKSLLQE